MATRRKKPGLLTFDGDKGRLVFMQMRVDEFARLWHEFMRAGGDLDLSDETVVQVVNGLPIETLRDWQRARK